MGSSIKEIDSFLDDLREGIDTRKFIPIDRQKNKDTLSILGITWLDAKYEIYALTAQNYISGPEIDRNFPSSDSFWIFKKVIDGQLIYIKVKVLYLEDGSVKAVSFHIDNM